MPTAGCSSWWLSPKLYRWRCCGAPGELGADIVCGEAQSFGVPMSLRRASPGLHGGRRQKLVRQLPGRLVGADASTANGTPRLRADALATREQHIRRERATSNICTNQGLCLLMATIYLALLGPRRAAPAGRASTWRRRNTPRARVRATPGLSLPVDCSHGFNEFVVSGRRRPPARAGPGTRRRHASAASTWPRRGPRARPRACWSAPPSSRARARPSIAWSERVGREAGVSGGDRRERVGQCDEWLCLRGAAALSSEVAVRAAMGYSLPASGCTGSRSRRKACSPKRAVRDEACRRCPELSEVDVVRHFTRLSTWNAAVDLGALPARLLHHEVQPEASTRSSRDCPASRAAHPLQPEAL